MTKRRDSVVLNFATGPKSEGPLPEIESPSVLHGKRILHASSLCVWLGAVVLSREMWVVLG